MTAEIDRPIEISIPPAPLPAIGEVMPRRLVTVLGEVGGTHARSHGHSRSFVCVLADATGELDLVFLGRLGVGGFDAGRRVEVSGTPFWQAGRLVMLNPIYTLLPPR